MDMILVGAGGYAWTYLALIDQNDQWGELRAVVDPYAAASKYFPVFQKHGIPIYDRIEDCLQKHRADLVIIVSPITFHESQVIAALQSGAHVLCEKPLVPSLRQLQRIRQVRKDSGKELGVGFQWSFSPTMRGIKADILAGRFGAPVKLKTFLSWPRPDSYYQGNGWKGHITDAQGRLVRDSIVTNATAHYLHNIFFLLGDSMDHAALPTSIEASLYRGRDIQSFDTCFLKGTFACGAQFFYAGSHVVEKMLGPRFVYQFEQATLRMDDDSQDVVIHWKDGRTEKCGNPSLAGEQAAKYFDMRHIALHPGPPVCGIETVAAFTAVCDVLFDRVPVQDFDPSLMQTTQDSKGRFVKGLYDLCERAYAEAALPTQSSAPWAAPATQVDMEAYLIME